MSIQFRETATLRLLALTLAMACGPVLAQAYRITDLGNLGVDTSDTSGQAINNAGQVTGYSVPDLYSGFHAFLWADGVMLDIHTKGEGPGMGFAINDRGEVAGQYTASPWGGFVQGFVFRGGEMHGIGTLAGGYNSYPSGLNNRGQVTGYANVADWSYHVFLWSDGVMSDLGTGDQMWAFGSGINDAGQIVGNFWTPSYDPHAFVYANGAFVDLNDIGDQNAWTRSSASAINNVGQVVGSKSPYSNSWAFIYDNGNFTYFTPPGLLSSAATGVNDLGEVVGEFDTGTGQSHAFVTIGLGLRDLNSRIHPLDPLKPYVTLVRATGINNNGWIVANGEDSRFPGVMRAYLLKPSIGQMLSRLLTLVTGVGPGTSLADKVTLAQSYYLSSDRASSADVLSAAMQQIRAQSGRGIDAAHATRLTAQISAIIRELQAT